MQRSVELEMRTSTQGRSMCSRVQDDDRHFDLLFFESLISNYLDSWLIYYTHFNWHGVPGFLFQDTLVRMRCACEMGCLYVPCLPWSTIAFTITYQLLHLRVPM